MSEQSSKAETVVGIVRDGSLPVRDRLRRAVRIIGDRADAGFSVQDCVAHLNDTDQIVNEVHARLANLSDKADQTLAAYFKQRLAEIEISDRCMLDIIDSAASQFLETWLDSIMRGLEEGVTSVPETAIREARQHRERMIPRLTQALKNAVAGVREEKKPAGNAHLLALYLLTEFKATEAFPALLEAISLPGDLAEDLFGDAVLDLPPRIFALFLGDQVEKIAAVVDDRSLDYSPRWLAANSYLYLVRDGRLDRGEAVQRLRRHLQEAIAHQDIKIITPLIMDLNTYAPVEAMDVIREAYQRGLTDGFIALSDVASSIAKGDVPLRAELARCKSLNVDTLEELCRWTSFKDKFNAGDDGEPPAPRQSTFAPRPVERSDRMRIAPEPPVPQAARVGRNDPCPCGSGKKFKKCCGARS